MFNQWSSHPETQGLAPCPRIADMPPGPEIQYVADSDALQRVTTEVLRSPFVSVDTESNGFFRYPDQVCLVQLATDTGCYLVDPLAVDTPDSLGLILRDPSIRKILHSGDNDIRTLDKEWGLNIVNLYDTSIGARFLGLEKLGLGNVAEEVLGLKLAKDKRLQRADWGLRPLSDEALAYAASDVLHLKRLMDELVRSTDALGRSAWVEEECRRIEDVRYSPPDPPEKSFISIKGNSGLDGRGLAILRELAVFRESAALKIGRPTFRVMPDKTLVAIAQDPTVDLKSVPGIGPYGVRRYGKAIARAVARGKSSKPVDRRDFRRPSPPRPSHEQMANMKQLKAWRSGHGKRLSLDQSLIWPADSLDRLARAPSTLDQELNSPDVRRWQVSQFADSLRHAIKRLHPTG